MWYVPNTTVDDDGELDSQTDAVYSSAAVTSRRIKTTDQQADNSHHLSWTWVVSVHWTLPDTESHCLAADMSDVASSAHHMSEVVLTNDTLRSCHQRFSTKHAQLSVTYLLTKI